MAIEMGLLNDEERPVPLFKVAWAPSPAIVDTVPAGDTRRMRLLL